MPPPSSPHQRHSPLYRRCGSPSHPIPPNFPPSRPPLPSPDHAQMIDIHGLNCSSMTHMRNLSNHDDVRGRSSLLSFCASTLAKPLARCLSNAKAAGATIDHSARNRLGIWLALFGFRFGFLELSELGWFCVSFGGWVCATLDGVCGFVDMGPRSGVLERLSWCERSCEVFRCRRI